MAMKKVHIHSNARRTGLGAALAHAADLVALPRKPIKGAIHKPTPNRAIVVRASSVAKGKRSAERRAIVKAMKEPLSGAAGESSRGQRSASENSSPFAARGSRAQQNKPGANKQAAVKASVSAKSSSPSSKQAKKRPAVRFETKFHVAQGGLPGLGKKR